LLRVVNEHEYNKYKNIFHILDNDDDGALSKKDLCYSFHENKIPITMEEIEEMIDIIEYLSENPSNNEKQISFTSFMITMINNDEKIKQDKNLINFLFKYFDIDNLG